MVKISSTFSIWLQISLMPFLLSQICSHSFILHFLLKQCLQIPMDTGNKPSFGCLPLKTSLSSSDTSQTPLSGPLSYGHGACCERNHITQLLLPRERSTGSFHEVEESSSKFFGATLNDVHGVWAKEVSADGDSHSCNGILSFLSQHCVWHIWQQYHPSF